MAALPPGLQGNLIEFNSGGDSEWLPFKLRKVYTNAFIVHNGQVGLNHVQHDASVSNVYCSFFLDIRKEGLGKICTQNSILNPFFFFRIKIPDTTVSAGK